jgi:hypothetical protein
MIDPILHAMAALIMTWAALQNPYLLALAIGFGWLLRELAQRGDLIESIKSMPSWPVHKHVEWIAPLVAAFLVVFVCGLAFAEELPKGFGHPNAGEKHWYDAQCCGLSDCEAVPDSAVSESASGFAFHYQTFAGKEIRGFVKRGTEKTSKDSRWHACTMPSGVRCAYRPIPST